jgi:hypothetical protein
MMFLIDTHTFIWYVTDNSRLSNQVLELINDENNQIFLSIASVWEMGIKPSYSPLEERGGVRGGVLFSSQVGVKTPKYVTKSKVAQNLFSVPLSVFYITIFYFCY